MSTKPTVFVVDDDPDMRDALKWLIESVGLPVEVFPSGEAFLIQYQVDRAGCLLLDLRMPGLGGMHLLKRIKTAEGATLPVIVLTGHGDVPTAVRALKAGAFDFIEKPAIDQELLDRIQDALNVDQIDRCRHKEKSHARNLLKNLTEREREVLNQIVQGESNKAVAANLGLSERTIEKYRLSIMQKTESPSFACLVRMIVLHGLDSESTTLRG